MAANGNGIDGLEYFDPPSKAKPKDKDPTRNASGGRKGGMSIDQLQRALTASFEMVGIAVAGFDKFDGEVIVSRAGDLGAALTDVARANPKVRARLEALVEVGAWGGVLSIVGAQIAIPIAVHHELLPKEINGWLADNGGIPTTSKQVETD